jgi:hypothetical protein
MLYRFRTECPRCNKVGEVVSAQPAPYVRCGDCLMDDVEIVTMLLIPLPEVPA